MMKKAVTLTLFRPDFKAAVQEQGWRSGWTKIKSTFGIFTSTNTLKIAMKKQMKVPLAARFLQLVFEHQDLLLESQVLALRIPQIFAQSLQLRAVLSFSARQLLLVQQRLLLQVSTQASHLLSLVHGGRCCRGAGLLRLVEGEGEVTLLGAGAPTWSALDMPSAVTFSRSSSSSSCRLYCSLRSLIFLSFRVSADCSSAWDSI